MCVYSSGVIIKSCGVCVCVCTRSGERLGGVEFGFKANEALMFFSEVCH